MINTNIAKIVFSEIKGTPFEEFGNEFLPAILGINYIPAGGYHDGGSDGLVRQEVYESRKKDTHFIQISVDKSFKTKIKNTIKRLKEVGRSPKKLTYFTSQHIPNIDLVENEIYEETDVFLKIYDLNWILGNLNKDAHTKSAYLNKVQHFEQSLLQNIHQNEPSNDNTAAYVFLRQEIQENSGDISLVNAAADSLILWSLEGTDPDKDKFLTIEEIKKKIFSQIPAAKNIIGGALKIRLDALSQKSNPNGREVRYHKNPDRYALPYDTRMLLNDQIIEDEALKVDVIESFENRLSDINQEDEFSDQINDLAKIALRTIQITFEEEGLEFSHFLTNQDSNNEKLHIDDHIEQAVEKLEYDPSTVMKYRDSILDCLKGAFYCSEECERLYFSKLSQTYALLFSLRAEPRIIEFFQNMGSDFRLLVGTDIIVKALSERFLHPEDQQSRNMLKMLKQAGSDLLLTEPVLEEVLHHIRTSDFEFKNEFMDFENAVLPYDLSRHAKKILIRAYLYAKESCPVEEEKPRTWENYIHKIIDYGDLHKAQAIEQIKRYLMNEFGFIFIDNQYIDEKLDNEKVEELTKLIAEDKQKDELARNDAKLALLVYQQRRKLHESSNTSQFGFKTWWLTEETRILRHTRELVKVNSGSRYMMRPQFILYFFSLAPSMASVRNTYSSIFPSLLGIRLASRVKNEVFSEMIKNLKEAAKEDPAKLNSNVSIMADKIKGDFRKSYELEKHPFDDN